MRYIVIMSLAGSLLQLFYYLTNNKKVSVFSHRQQDVLCRGILFFYLIPLVFVEPIYRWVIVYLPLPEMHNATGIYEYSYFYSKVDGKILVNKMYKLQIALFLIWVFIALIILCYRIFRYIRKRNLLLSGVQPVTEGAAYELLKKVCKEQGIKRNLRLYHMPTTAVTMGTLKPVILCNCEENEEVLEMIFQHECSHIRRWDVLTRQLVIFAQSIHWFNPLVYQLPKLTERIFEICCDGAVVKNADMHKRKVYATMLVMQSPRNAEGDSALFYALSGNAKELEERIQEIMYTKTRTKRQTVLAVILLSVVLFMDSWTVLAYPDVKEIEVDSSEEFHPNADSFFVENGVVGPYGNMDFTILYEKQFVDEEGNIYPVQEESGATAVCQVCNRVSGQQQEHEENADGGCTIKVYEAQRCSICGEVKRGNRIQMTTVTVCPH